MEDGLGCLVTVLVVSSPGWPCVGSLDPEHGLPNRGALSWLFIF